jgi:hypothetical protein
MNIKFVEGYYESTRNRDAVINESSQNSNFHRLARFLTPRNADIKRNEDYTEFFNKYGILQEETHNAG